CNHVPRAATGEPSRCCSQQASDSAAFSTDNAYESRAAALDTTVSTGNSGAVGSITAARNQCSRCDNEHACPVEPASGNRSQSGLAGILSRVGRQATGQSQL